MSVIKSAVSQYRTSVILDELKELTSDSMPMFNFLKDFLRESTEKTDRDKSENETSAPQFQKDTHYESSSQKGPKDG
jgi:hypothetical protein